MRFARAGRPPLRSRFLAPLTDDDLAALRRVWRKLGTAGSTLLWAVAEALALQGFQAPLVGAELPAAADRLAEREVAAAGRGAGEDEIAEPGDLRIVVRDEVWKQMRLGLEPVKTLDSNLRLSRHAGDVQVVVYHKPSDPLAAGRAPWARRPRRSK